MKKLLTTGLIIFMVFACKQSPTVNANKKISADQMKAAQSAQKEEQANLEETALGSGQLIHTVYFNLKYDLNEAKRSEFVNLLKSLSEINYIKSVQVGTPVDTGDPRLYTDYDVALLMAFANEADLARYQQDSFHLAKRAATAAYLAGPPIVYDYYTK